MERDVNAGYVSLLTIDGDSWAHFAQYLAALEQMELDYNQPFVAALNSWIRFEQYTAATR
jgi:hypothetical protein